MTYASTGVIGANAVIIENAKKAIGSIIVLDQNAFIELVRKSDNPLIIYSPSKFLSQNKYLMKYKGFTFFTKSKFELKFSNDIELIKANKIILPQL